MKLYIVMWDDVDREFCSVYDPAIFTTLEGAIEYVEEFVKEWEETNETKLDIIFDPSWLQKGLPFPNKTYVIWNPNFAMWIIEKIIQV